MKEPTDHNLYIQPLEGGAKAVLAENVARAVTTAVWAPDGGRVLFTNDRDGGDDMWSVRVQEGRPAGLPELVQKGVGRLLDVTRGGECYYQTSPRTEDLYVAGVDPQTGKLASRPKKITTSGAHAGAAWSPDGEYLAYYAVPADRGPSSPMLRSIRTGQERGLVPRFVNIGITPQWFPDSRFLFVSPPAGKLAQFDIQAGESRPWLESVTLPHFYQDDSGMANYISVVLAPDARAVYYLTNDREAHQTSIFRLDAQDGSKKELCRTDLVTGLAVSPDGSRIAFVKTRTEAAPGVEPKPVWSIMTLPTSGGEPKEVYRVAPPFLSYPRWSKDGRRVFFLRGGPASDVFSIPAEGGEAQPLGISLHALSYLNIHPDGTQIVFTDSQSDNQLWVLKNLFNAAKAGR